MSTNLIFVTIFIILISGLCGSPTMGRKHGEHKHCAKLRVGFYQKSCPQAEQIVEEVVRKATFEDPSIAASLIRLYFHDCFVKGCDASVLLDTTPTGEETEKTSPGNLGLRGFELIDEAKAKLEEVCPHTVSCADIISFATRDAVAISGIAPYDVPAGRRDGRSSVAKDVFGNLPFPNANVEQMVKVFNKKGMNKADLVTLLGAHSIGKAHCFIFENQFYNFNATHLINPKLDTFHAMYLRAVCPAPGTSTTQMDDTFPLNPFMGNRLSTLFYGNVLQGRAIMESDQSLLDDQTTNDMVRNYFWRSLQWSEDFRAAMVKLGKVGVLTGHRGEIRNSCRVVNS